jgi:hypothetical protein
MEALWSSMVRKRPCTECGHWFFPDPRVGDRQRACSNAECQAARRKKTQASWRAHNADYFVARRMAERAARAAIGTASAPVRMPRPLDRLPWDVAQDEFGVQGAEFLGVMGRVLLGAVQDQRHAQVPDTS